jgi:hypothetical protein
MRKLSASLLAFVVVCAAAAAADAQPLRLAPRIMLSPGELARVQAAASQGPEALRQFLWRTRMIYNWSWDDLIAAD